MSIGSRCTQFFFGVSLVLSLFAGSITLAQEPPPSPSSEATPQQASPTSFEITGTVRSGKTPLPGVTVSASNTLTGKKYSAATASNGAYSFTGLPRGRYVIRVEFMGFAAQTQEIILKPETPSGKFDAEMVLASRQQEQSDKGIAALLAAGRGFQSLTLDNALSDLPAGNAPGGFGGAASPDTSGLPLSGAGADAPTESVSITGAQGRSQDFGNGNEQDIQDRIQEFRDRAVREGLIPGGPGGGGLGGPGGILGGPNVIRIGGGRGGFNINQPHGLIYASDNDASFDARPFSLTGLQTPKASYNLARFGANVGGPLNIPKVFNGGAKWFYFVGWNGTRGSTPYDSFSTVPTLAERNGDFSAATNRDGTPVQIFNPANGQQFVFNGQANVIGPALINSAAKSLLQLIPLPNLDTPTRNFHLVTNDNSDSDTIILRLVHNFGSSPAPTRGGRGGGGAGGGRRRAQNNLSFGLNWARTSSQIVNPFPSLFGHNGTQGLNANTAWTYGNGKATNNLRFTCNHNHVATANLFSNNVDVAAEAGIGGVSTNPFDFGVPGINFTTFGGLTDPTPRRELDQTYTLSDTLSWSRGKHNWRFGADYRRILQSFRSAKNAEGNFIFTGFATAENTPGGTQPVADTGLDFADFLIGLPQQTSLQSGANSYDFRANSMDLFAQDDFRYRANLSFNLGLRYEYNGPYTEAHNQIANLNVAPGFTSALPILPGQGFGASLIHPDRNDFAPRLGLAWKPLKQTVVRAGYGVNYNLAQYGNIIQNFAFQPPFAITSTNLSSPAAPLTLQNGFPAPIPGAITNNFAVDPNYRLGYVQIWNVDIQQQLRGGVLLNIDYNGSKGTRLDIERAIDIAGLQPFTYESSAGNSVYHSGSIRMRKRLAHGVGLSGTYIYSKSIDDASSIGGGAGIVAQNPFDIAADRGLSSFDQRHKFTGNWIYDFPFGDNHRFASKGFLLQALGGWQWSGDFTIASGLPFTPRVLGNAVDLSRGVTGSLRANVTGEPINLPNPTAQEFFNTAAFCSPVAPGISSPTSSNPCVNPSGSTFGDAGRDIIEGPGQITVDTSLSKTFTIKESRALEFRVQATNIFNSVQFTAINTTVNSLTFGQVTTTANMRRLTLLARFRF